MQTTANGLEDVVAVTTRIGMVDGERGELVVRGQRMEEYAPEHTYEEAMALLLAPDCDEHVETLATLGRARQIACERIERRGLFEHASSDPMDYLRAALETVKPTGDAVRDAVSVAATLCVAAPAWHRVASNERPFAADPTLSQAADFLHMLTGTAPTEALARALDTYLVTVSDHGMNASTFTARVIASTQSDLVSAVAGALGALKGPLHGGAPGPVLDMLDAIGEPGRAEDWIRRELSVGRRIMGMGHRVYRVRDPRAAIFEAALAKLEGETATPRLTLARAVEHAAEKVLAERHPDRALRANVEFYTAVLLEAVGVPRELFTPTFAVGRVLGWSAHVIEQQREGRLIRPRSQYVGVRA